MAKWGGEADAAVETAGGGGGNFVPAPRGIYTIEVLETQDGTTKESKRPKVDLECEIIDEGEHFGKKVWLTITHIPKGEKGHGLMLHSLHAFGLALDGGYELDTTDLQGQHARALLGVTTREKVKDGRTYVNEVNFIEELYTAKHPEPANDALPPPKQPRTSKPTAAPAQTAAATKPAVAKPGAAKIGF